MKFQRITVEMDGFRIGGSAKKGNMLVASESRNCDLSDGTISCGVGMEAYTLNGKELAMSSSMPDQDEFFLYSKRAEDGSYTKALGYVSLKGTVFLYNNALDKWQSRYFFNPRVKTLSAVCSNEEILSVFVGDSGVFSYTEETGMVATEITRATTAACVFKGRVFCGVDPFTVAYSAPFDPTNFSESVEGGGRIVFPSDSGKIVALAPMKEKMFIFYEYGISVLEVGGSPRDFVVKKLGYSGGKIFGDSVGVCAAGGEKAFFLAEDGLYVFDGSLARAVCKNLCVKPKRTGQVCQHAQFEGKYMLSFRDKNDSLRGVTIDAETNEGYYSFAPEGLSVCEGQAVCYFAEKARRLLCNGELPGGDKYLFYVDCTEFGLPGKKTLEKLSFEGEGTVNVIVSCGDWQRKATLKFQGGRAEMRIGLFGETYGMRLELERGAKVAGVKATMARLNGNLKEVR